jgi:predicted acyl esterase
MRTPPLGCAVSLALVITPAVLVLLAQTPPPAPSPSRKESPPASADYDLRWGGKIPMRDKVELNATLYLPKTTDGSLPRMPVIFTLTPYISDTYQARAAYLVSHGYAFALVDVRGRGNSSGGFEPFAQEPRDGQDAVEWLAQQPFCDGKVAMWGGSYAGFDQWATAKEFPPHLATIVPVAAAHLTYDPLDTKRGENVEGIDPKEKTAGLDQTYALTIGNDGLVYHTAPFPNETPLIGCQAVTLWVSIDTADTDLSADLYEIQPDGTSIALWSDLRRLRYRESLRQGKLVKPGEIVRCEFNPGLFVARNLMKGSRLRLVGFLTEFDLMAKELQLRRRCRR